LSLDILTPRGEISVQHAREAYAIWHQHKPKLYIARTLENKPAKIDGLMVNEDSEIVGALEVKCRPGVTLEKFENEYDCEWLVTFDKITSGVSVAAAHCVPFYGFLYLPAVPGLLVRQIWSPDEGYTVEFRVAKTRTQATTNGGTILRDNAFINMREASLLRPL
jgi:hypothetical protein